MTVFPAAWKESSLLWSPPALLEQLDAAEQIEVIDTFLEDAAQRLAVLKTAWAQRDMATVQAQAHSLKGSCYLLDVDSVALVCEEMEALAKEENAVEGAARVKLLARQLGLIGGALQSYRERLQAARLSAPAPARAFTQKPTRALVAEDNPVFRKALLDLLAKWNYEVTAASDGKHALELLSASDGPRLAILDWMMPGMDGPEVCRRVRARQGQRYVYILLLTAKSEAGNLLEGMDAGADDYLTKPFDAGELRVRLRAGRRILELQEELEAAKEALRHKAMHDGLTGLYNRTAIFEVLERELARAQREGGTLAVVMADLDYFKEVNDSFGHASGDRLLVEVARRMQAVLRPYDTLGRYGGEEFLALLPGCGGAEAFNLAERLRAAISAQPLSATGGTTISLGVSWTATLELFNSDALIQAADAALYRAKRNGRNRTELAGSEPEPALTSGLPALARR